MNREKVQRLRDHIAALPEEQFNYSQWWTVTEDTGDTDFFHEWLHGGPMPPCGTPGCVAGHCVILFGLRPKGNYLEPSEVAAEELGLSAIGEEFLFLAKAGYANRSDALKRLDWLLAEKDITQYPWEEESWNSPTS